MRIDYDGIWATLVVEDVATETVAFNLTRQRFSVLDENRYTIRAFQRGWWDGYHNFIDKNGKFLRGMVGEVGSFLTSNGVHVSHPPLYTPHVELAARAWTENLAGITLWEHQRRMTHALLKFGGGTVEGVTGSGKTESIALLIKLLLEDPKTDVILFLVHLIGLADQTKMRMEKRSPSIKSLCGFMAEGSRPNEHHRVIFSTYQSALSALGMTKQPKDSKKLRKPPEEEFVGLFSRVTAVIIDECHHASQDDYVRLLDLAGGVPVYQFSGTPEVDDPLRDWNIIGVGGPILERVKRPELEEKGIIAKAIACLREFPHVGKRKAVDWVPDKRETTYFVKAVLVDPEGEIMDGVVKIDPEKGMEPRVDNQLPLLVEYARDSLILDLDRTYDMMSFCRECVKQGRNVIVLCERVAQVLYVYGLFKKEFKVAYVHGESPLKVRKLRKQQFSTGEFNVLIASSIFDEGEDVDNVGAVALASGGSSLVKLVQRIGRGVRRKSGMGNWIPIFCPVDSRNKYVKDHSIQRLDYLERAHITSELAVGPWEPFLTDLSNRMITTPS